MANPAPTRPPLIFLFFFGIFGCIGVTVLVFLWGHPDKMGDPPLFFRLVGSFIALAFIFDTPGCPRCILLIESAFKSFSSMVDISP